MSSALTKRGRVLVIAGSDSGAGAGLQADIKAIHAQGAFATTAVSVLTAQNTRGVQGIFEVPADFVAAQMVSVLSDIGADMVKTGMLATRAVIEKLAETLATEAKDCPRVIDPVMVATSGDVLLQAEAIDALKSLLVQGAYVVTPNLPEASLLTGREVETLDDMKRAADTLMNMGARNALVKGGHGKESVVTDLLAMQSGFDVFEHKRLETRNTHGTGCSLASSLAGLLARHSAEAGEAIPDNAALRDATGVALDYVHQAIANAPNLGDGHGPLWH